MRFEKAVKGKLLFTRDTFSIWKAICKSSKKTMNETSTYRDIK